MEVKFTYSKERGGWIQDGNDSEIDRRICNHNDLDRNNNSKCSERIQTEEEDLSIRVENCWKDRVEDEIRHYRFCISKIEEFLKSERCRDPKQVSLLKMQIAIMQALIQVLIERIEE